MNSKKRMGGKVLEVVSQENFLSEDKIKEALTRKVIKDYAYILHDKDTIDLTDKKLTEEEAVKRVYIDFKDNKIKDIFDIQGEKKTIKKDVFEKYVEDVKKNPEKKPHWHVLLYLPDNYTYVDEAAKWFGVPENFVQVKRTGRGRRSRDTLLDCVEYLTHRDLKQQELGKFQYSDEEIHASFDFRDELAKRLDEKLKYGKALSDRERLQVAVLYEGLSLKQARLKDPLNYNKDMMQLKRNRNDYLSNQRPPVMRLNLYISGTGGKGKDLMARAIAKSMFSPNGELDDDEVYFEVGAENAEFEGYDGQPVIIWQEARAENLLRRWGRENLFGGILEPYPVVARRQNVKYSSINLINSINIFTGPDSWEEFLDGLVAEHKNRCGVGYKKENKAQSYRRFPLVIPVRKDEFDILINEGFMEGNCNWEQYRTAGRVRGSFSSLYHALRGESRRKAEAALVAPVKDKVSGVIKKIEEGVPEDSDNLDEFEEYGVVALNDFQADVVAMSDSKLMSLAQGKYRYLPNFMSDPGYEEEYYFVHEELERRSEKGE